MYYLKSKHKPHKREGNGSLIKDITDEIIEIV
jgi:hypothetical protein